MLYKSFLSDGVISCCLTERRPFDRSYDIVFVEDKIMTNLYINIVDGAVEVNICQSAPRYPIYDAKGNIIYFGI